MQRAEILKIAQKAGGRFDGSNWKFACDFDDEQLELFAALVSEKAAAEENEACALVCDEIFDKSATIEVLKASRKIRARHNTKKEPQ